MSGHRSVLTAGAAPGFQSCVWGLGGVVVDFAAAVPLPPPSSIQKARICANFMGRPVGGRGVVQTFRPLPQPAASLAGSGTAGSGT